MEPNQVNSVWIKARNTIQEAYNDFTEKSARKVQAIMEDLEEIDENICFTVSFMTHHQKTPDSMSFYWTCSVDEQIVENLEDGEELLDKILESNSFTFNDEIKELIEKLRLEMVKFKDIPAPGPEGEVTIDVDCIYIDVPTILNGLYYLS